MYSGEKLDIDHFKGKFDISSIQGTVDQRGCHHVFLKTCSRYRVSQFASAIDKFNQRVPDTSAMRLQKEPFQPAIVTMTEKKMEGRIYFKIMEDIQKKEDGERSEYWNWEKTGVGSTMQQQASFLQSQADEQQEILNNKRLRLQHNDGEGAATATTTSSESVVEAGEPQPASLEHEVEMKAKDERHAEELKTVEAKYEDRIRDLETKFQEVETARGILERKLGAKTLTLTNLETLRKKELRVSGEMIEKKVSHVFFSLCVDALMCFVFHTGCGDSGVEGEDFRPTLRSASWAIRVCRARSSALILSLASKSCCGTLAPFSITFDALFFIFSI